VTRGWTRFGGRYEFPSRRFVALSIHVGPSIVEYFLERGVRDNAPPRASRICRRGKKTISLTRGSPEGRILLVLNRPEFY
jgi:hypothetical protein